MKFFRPDKERLILLAIFLIISSVIKRNLAMDAPPYHGFPIAFYNPSGHYGPLGKFVQERFYPAHFLLDVLIWYILSCLVIWAYDFILERKKARPSNGKERSFNEVLKELTEK